jgi:addiction module RelB/DinJ family antitoxin
MSHINRTATVQARVFPAIKEASERVLSRIGLNMSEAMELFLRRIIVDERIPFDVVALDATYLKGSKIERAPESAYTASGNQRDRKKRI